MKTMRLWAIGPVPLLTLRLSAFGAAALTLIVLLSVPVFSSPVHSTVSLSSFIPPRYRVTLLNANAPRDFRGWGGVTAMNDRGSVVGTFAAPDSDNAYSHNFFYTHGTWHYLNIFPVAVNDRNQIVNGDGGRCLWMWQSGHSLRLSVPPGRRAGIESLNNKEDLAGLTIGHDDSFHAAIWRGVRRIDLDPPQAYTQGEAVTINNYGQALVMMQRGRSRHFVNVPYLWHKGQWQKLADLIYHSDTPLNDDYLLGQWHLNDMGEVSAQDSATDYRVFLLHGNRVTVLKKRWKVVGLTNQGQVIGVELAVTPPAEVPAVWQSGQAWDLNSLLPKDYQMDDLQAVNSRGQIVGNGTYWGKHYLLLLTPTDRAEMR